MNWTAADPDYAARVEASFARQQLMATLGARLQRVEPGRVVIELPFDERLTQQHGYLHAGAVTAVVDSACGYAALTLLPAGAGVLAVEFKINLVAPARGERFEAHGEVMKSGRTLSIARGTVEAITGDQRQDVAYLQSTIINVHGRDAVQD